MLNIAKSGLQILIVNGSDYKSEPAGYKLQIEVLNPFPMERSLIAPAFGQPGLGVQYRTPISIKHLEELGYIKFY